MFFADLFGPLRCMFGPCQEGSSYLCPGGTLSQGAFHVVQHSYLGLLHDLIYFQDILTETSFSPIKIKVIGVKETYVHGVSGIACTANSELLMQYCCDFCCYRECIELHLGF